MTVAVLCFPCAGASAMASYAHWNRWAPVSLTVRPVELPGRGMRTAEAEIRDFSALADDLTEVAQVHATDDYVLFGHSFGALLAFECAHRLISRGLPAPRLLVAACCAGPLGYDTAKFDRVWSDEALEREIVDRNGLSDELLRAPGLRRLVLDQTASDFAALAGFSHDLARPALTCPIVVLGGRSDELPRQDLAIWDQATLATVTLELFDGGHFFFQHDPRLILKRIDHALAARSFPEALAG